MFEQAHLPDIDFRTRTERSLVCVTEFKKWYNELADKPYSTEVQSQLALLSAVLWHLLPKKEFNELRKRKA